MEIEVLLLDSNSTLCNIIFSVYSGAKFLYRFCHHILQASNRELLSLEIKVLCGRKIKVGKWRDRSKYTALFMFLVCLEDLSFYVSSSFQAPHLTTTSQIKKREKALLPYL